MSRGFGIAAVVALLAAVLAALTHIGSAATTHLSPPAPPPTPPPGPAMVVGDSMVARSVATVPANARVKMFGYAGKAPSGQVGSDYAAAGSPKTVVLNWNGNNPERYPGAKLVEVYRTTITNNIHWYLDHGTKTIILAAAVPSAFNCEHWQVSWTSSLSTMPGAMLGNNHFNDLYKQLAQAFPGKVFYSEKAARAIHPGMTCSPKLNGQLCVADYIHLTPHCEGVYGRALEDLATGGPTT